MAFCRTCGTDMGDAKFCPECGAPDAARAGPAATPPHWDPQPQTAPPRQRSVAWGVFLGLFLFFIVLPLVLFIGCGACAGVFSQ
jgi:uncharacterized membrane protein YvbJ